jgi:hypothetical protein
VRALGPCESGSFASVSVVPVDPDHFFKPELAAQFGRRTHEVRSPLSRLGRVIYPVRVGAPASEDGPRRLKNVRLPNISVAPIDPHHLFKPKLAAQFGRRTLEVRSSLSWLGNAIYPVPAAGRCA